MQVKLHFLPLETSWVLESRVRFMYEMQHFVHNFPLTREQGLLRDFLVFSHLCRKKWNFEPILKFVGSNFEWVLTLVSKNRWVLTIRPSVYWKWCLENNFPFGQKFRGYVKLPGSRFHFVILHHFTFVFYTAEAPTTPFSSRRLGDFSVSGRVLCRISLSRQGTTHNKNNWMNNH